MSIGPPVMAFHTYAARLRCLFDQQAAERRDLEFRQCDERGVLNDSTNWDEATFEQFFEWMAKRCAEQQAQPDD